MTINIDDLREPAELPEWFADREFLDIISDGIESAHQRYRDPKNRAKGPMPETLGPSFALAICELEEFYDEYCKHKVGEGDGASIRWEGGDLVLTVCNVIRALGEV